MENKSNDMATKIFSLTPSEQQAKWDDIMGQMISFVSETNADLDMAYDWVCEMSQPFVHDDAAYSCFYDVYCEAAE